MELFFIVIFILLISNFVVYKKENVDAKEHSFIFADTLGQGLLTSVTIVIALESEKITHGFYLFPILFIIMIYIGYGEKEIYEKNKDTYDFKLVIKNIFPTLFNKSFFKKSFLKIAILIIFNLIAAITIYAYVNPTTLYMCLFFLIITSSILVFLQFKNKITGINF